MKYYFLLFFVFCILIGGGTYVLDSNPIALSFFGKTFSMPLSGWILCGVALFFMSSLILFAKDRIERFCFQFYLKRDFNALIAQMKSQILGREVSPSNLKNPYFQALAKALGRVKIAPNFQVQPSQNQAIDELIEDLRKLEEGEVLKEDFPKYSYFWEKNICNKVQINSKYAFEVLEGDYPKELKHKVLFALLNKEESLQDKSVSKILKMELEEKDCKMLLEYFLDKGYNVGLEDFRKLLVKIEIKQWLHYAQRFVCRFDPDFCLSLFKKLSASSKKVYVYLLLYYSMFDQARELLKEGDEELQVFEAYLKLRDCGHEYPLELFVKE